MPVNVGNAIGVGIVEASRGNTTEALRRLQVAEQLVGENSFRLAQLARAYSLMGRSEDAMRMFVKLEEVAEKTLVGDAIWAAGYIAIGDFDQALQRIQSAVRDRVPTDFVTLTGVAANSFSIPELERPEFRELLDTLWIED